MASNLFDMIKEWRGMESKKSNGPEVNKTPFNKCCKIKIGGYLGGVGQMIRLGAFI